VVERSLVSSPWRVPRQRNRQSRGCLDGKRIPIFPRMGPADAALAQVHVSVGAFGHPPVGVCEKLLCVAPSQLSFLRQPEAPLPLCDLPGRRQVAVVQLQPVGGMPDSQNGRTAIGRPWSVCYRSAWKQVGRTPCKLVQRRLFQDPKVHLRQEVGQLVHTTIINCLRLRLCTAAFDVNDAAWRTSPIASAAGPKHTSRAPPQGGGPVERRRR
jgi:hypothetical protein